MSLLNSSMSQPRSASHQRRGSQQISSQSSSDYTRIFRFSVSAVQVSYLCNTYAYRFVCLGPVLYLGNFMSFVASAYTCIFIISMAVLFKL